MLDPRFRQIFSGIGQLPQTPMPGMQPAPSPTTMTGAELDPISGMPISLRRSAPNGPMDENPWNDAPPAPNNNPDDPAYRAFVDLVNNFPTRKEPSTLRKIGASIAAFSGNPEIVDNALYPGYNRDVTDWKNKVSATGQLANIEAGRDSRAIREEYNALMAQIRRDDLERKKTEGERRGDQADRRLDQRDEELDIKRGQLDLRRETANGAQGIRVNQRTGQTYLWYKDGTIKNLDQQDLSFEHRQKLAQAGRLELLDLQQQFTRERDATQHEYDLEEILKRVEARAGGNTSEADKAKGKINRAGEYARAHPEVADWIEVDPDTGFIEMRPRGIWRDRARDAEIISDFNKYIDQGSNPGTGAVPGNNTSSVKPGSRFARPPAAAKPGARTPAKTPTMSEADIRKEAIRQLQEGKAPVTEPNIAAAIKQLRAKGM